MSSAYWCNLMPKLDMTSPSGWWTVKKAEGPGWILLVCQVQSNNNNHRHHHDDDDDDNNNKLLIKLIIIIKRWRSLAESNWLHYETAHSQMCQMSHLACCCPTKCGATAITAGCRESHEVPRQRSMSLEDLRELADWTSHSKVIFLSRFQRNSIQRDVIRAAVSLKTPELY